jgi:hypothetical protein
MTSDPGSLTEDDAEAVIATGVSRAALVDAVLVAALFNMITRLADAFGWHVPADEEVAARAEFRLGSSYALTTPAVTR